MNTAYLVPHGTMRFGVARRRGSPAGDAERSGRWVGWSRAGLADGAVGLSSGLEYLPGRFAAAAEIADLCRPVAAAGLPYVTHMRGYGVAAPSGMAEARAMAGGRRGRAQSPTTTARRALVPAGGRRPR